ncbi:hypothetical protein GCM10017744_008210 [Streptomyces antimycoticus]|uniref:Uncharacterized protein n=1 Tax=Streptomyces antimycoticus TaxID=68175 RepID=A0A4D4KPF2_9ACTN|nr:hypothetical protein SANT12839_091890 [Streptomyces antimycoticus]
MVPERADSAATMALPRAVQPRGLWVGLEGFDPLSLENRVEGLGIYAVPVTDHKAQRLKAHAHLKRTIADLLVVHCAVGCTLTPAMRRRRVPCSRKTSA